ncbi:MAG: NAD+ synthase [Spirochaetales bacterium]|nr:NAD+ synthase [Spirochaetales bacterium]
MKLALAQIDAVIGDFDGNRRLIVERVRDALSRDARVDLVVFPEMSLCGYPPLDLLDQDSFVERNLESLRRLQRELPEGTAVAVGLIDRNRTGSGKALVNAVAVIKDGVVVFRQEKTLLPTYDVFDESRYFEPARERRVLDLAGTRLGFAVCEDIWWEEPPVPSMRYPVDPVRELLDLGAELVVVPSASPFVAGKLGTRLRLAGDLAREGSVPVAYVNMAGAADSLVFDGRSFAVDREGRPVAMAGWGTETLFVDTDHPGTPVVPADDRMAEIEQVLVEGIRGYMRRCGFTKAHLGVSGGIDSALVAYLAVRAVGAENVLGLAMPSRFSSEGSITDSVELCRRLGMRMETISIEGPFAAFLEALSPHFGGGPFDLTEENLQARIRGNLLMAWSNKNGSMLLTTGNKSELACGYCTLYGDMAGAIAPIGDLLKTEVFALCESIDARAEMEGREPPIPRSIIDKPPSAELRPDQKDEDSLPPYALLDAILSRYIVDNRSAQELVGEGYEEAVVKRVVRLVALSEYKRRQAAPVIKVSPRAFGMGRRIPIARALHEASVR